MLSGALSSWMEFIGTEENSFCHFDSKANIPLPYLIIFLSCFSWLGSLLLCIGFIKYKRLRQPPGDLIFGISVAELMLSSHWIVSSVFSKGVYMDLSNDCAFCITNAVFSTSAGFLEYCYNICMCIYLVKSLRNALKASRVPGKSLHILTLTLTFCCIIYALSTDKLGKTLFGTCSIKWTPRAYSAYGGPVIVLLYAFISFNTFIYVRRNAPQCEKSSHRVTEFLKNYNKYIICSTIIWAVYAFMNLAATIVQNSNSHPEHLIRIIGTIGNIAKLSTPLVLTIIRYNDKAIKKTMKKLVYFWRSDDSKTTNIDLISHQPSASLLPNEMYQSARDEDRNLNVGGGILSKDLRIQLTHTILSGILFTTKVIQMDNVSIDHRELSKNPDAYSQAKEFQISKEIIQEYLPEINFAGYPTFSGLFKFHSPYLFDHLMKQDKRFINLQESIDFADNFNAIRKASGVGDGGKSGEFFFFSNDKKLIVKTIPKMELDKLLEILPDYTAYMEKHADSLIAKYYGVFTLQREGTDEEEHFLVMRNVCGLPSDYVERQYDMKGSTFDREVLKNQNIIELSELKGKGTLKDTDFFKYDQFLSIAPHLSSKFVTVMQRDASFFRQHNLIDYSLAVFIVNKKRYIDDNGQLPKSSEYHELCSMQSISQPDLWYNLGIIDYLQPYNLNKMIEKNLKKLIKRNLSLDTSSQPPEKYAARFSKFANRLVGLSIEVGSKTT